MTTTGSEDINLAPENTGSDDDHDNDDLNLDGQHDSTGTTNAQVNVPAAPGGGNGPTNFNL